MSKLNDELTDDPLGRGYSGMTDRAVVADMNTPYRDSNRSLMTATEIAQSIDVDEFTLLNTADEQTMWNVLSFSEINPFGFEATIFTDVFGGGSRTIAAFLAARVGSISRGQELSLGVVKLGHVQDARTE